MSARSFGILLAVTVMLVAAAYFLTRQDHDGIPSRGEPVFPGLLERINEVRLVTITSAQGTVTLSQKGDRWVVKEKHGYPAALDKLRPLLIGLAELTLLEPKTRNPELYPKLGLQEVTAPGSPARTVSVRDGNGADMARLILGNHRRSRADASRDELYVRRPDDPQTWLALGRMRPEGAPEAWIDRQVLDIDVARVRQVRVVHPDGSTVIVRKHSPGDVDFELVGLPAKSDVRSQISVNNVADQMANLTLDDVALRRDVTLPRKGGTTVGLETFDGLRVALTMVEQDGRHQATLSAEFDRTLVPPPPSGAGQTGERHGDSIEEEQAASNEEKATLKAPEAVQEEAEELNERLEGWVYVLPRFRAEALTPRKDSLIKAAATDGPRSKRS